MKPDFFRSQVEAGGKLLEVCVQPLGPDEQVDPAVRGRRGEPGFGAERRLVLHAGLIHALHPDVGAGIWVTMDDLECADDIPLRVDGRCRGLERLLHVGDRGQHRIVDRDLFQGRSGQLRILGGNDGHGLTGVAHDVTRQDRLVLDIEAERFLAGHIGRGENGADSGFGGGGRDVDAYDPGMWMRAAEGRSPKHAVAAQVAGVLELPFHLGDAVNPADRLADPALAPDFDTHAQIMDASLRFTRWPSWTTGRPSTKRCCTGRVLQNRRAATGSVSAPRKARPSTANSATSARFPTSIEPMSSRPRQAAPPRVATCRASRAVIADAPLRARVVSNA